MALPLHLAEVQLTPARAGHRPACAARPRSSHQLGHGKAPRLLPPDGRDAGGQAELLRVPFADVNCLVMPTALEDHRLVFLTDIYPTGYMAVEQCNVQPDDTVAVWGCGPVGQFTIRSAALLAAGRATLMQPSCFLRKISYACGAA